MSVAPDRFHRRSFVYPRLLAAGAEFADVEDAAVAVAFPGIKTPTLGLADLSPLPRTGVKGPRALGRLAENRWPVPERNNTARPTDSGAVVCRLGDREALVLAAPRRASPAHGRDVRQLEQAVLAGNAGAWQVPRRDSYCWFALRGADAVDCLQKLCGVDLRPAHFPAGTVAQTSVARLNTVICRGFDSGTPVFHLLADSPSALWFWDSLLDAMEEFGGGPMGLNEFG